MSHDLVEQIDIQTESQVESVRQSVLWLDFKGRCAYAPSLPRDKGVLLAEEVRGGALTVASIV